MKIVEYKNREEMEKIMMRQAFDSSEAIDSARPIVSAVKEKGDSALLAYTEKFDGKKIPAPRIKITKKEIDAAYKRVEPSLVLALKDAARNIKKYHKAQLSHAKKNWKTEVVKGVFITEKSAPLSSVGCYVPGGRAAYPSTVLMTVIPAKVAGVERVVVCSPQASDAVLVACDIAGANEVYRVGGAQAIAALAYGTKSIPKVDKIVGPGNRYVTAAKLLVYGAVDIDMPAGPSEVMIIADKTANPSYVAADLLAQAEHDPDAECILATDSEKLAEEVLLEMRKQVASLSRKAVIKESLENACVVLTRNMREAAELADRYAPEHLEIIAKDASGIASKIRNAGTVFLGAYAPVAAGDYASGENHVLPTGGAARFSSSLGVRDFLRHYSVQSISKAGLSRLSHTIETIAESESFTAHAEAVRRRLSE